MIKELAILHIYPDAKPNLDFIITAEPETLETTISQWNYELPQPTDEALQSAWNELQANPTNATPQPSVEDKLIQMEQDVADLWYSVMMGGLT